MKKIANENRILKPMGLEDRLNTEDGLCPVAERIQPQIMQFTTNQKDEAEMDEQADILRRTILDFS